MTPAVVHSEVVTVTKGTVHYVFQVLEKSLFAGYLRLAINIRNREMWQIFKSNFGNMGLFQ